MISAHHAFGFRPAIAPLLGLGLITALCQMTAPAHAEDARPAPTPAPQLEDAERWYGWQTVIADASSFTSPTTRR